MTRPAVVLLIRVTAGLLAATLLAGCSGSGHGNEAISSASPPSYVTTPFSHEQALVEAGASLIVSDGCSACHLSGAAGGAAPSFTHLAGHRVRLTDGRRLLVDEALIREALRRPASIVIAGYNSGPMVRAVERAGLPAHPEQIAELAAFIEQVGPE